MISIPYIEGDKHGIFTSELIRGINQATSLRYSNTDGDVLLKVAIVEVGNEQIGYRRDSMEDNGEFKEYLRAVEGRRIMKVKASLVDPMSCKEVWGPYEFSSDGDYDYVNEDSLQDLAFIDPTTGLLTTVLQFSLGQLEPIDNAQDAAMNPLYRKLSQKIVDAISAGW